MAVNGISGSFITGTLSNGAQTIQAAQEKADESRFLSLIEDMKSTSEKEGSVSEFAGSVSSSQVNTSRRLNGDYTEGFYNYYKSESDKTARPEGLAASVRNEHGKQPTIDRTSELYAQSKELENYMMKMMLSSMRDTIHHTSIFGKENDFARGMYEDMMYDNYAEALTKNTHFGLADQIYLELSGLR